LGKKAEREYFKNEQFGQGRIIFKVVDKDVVVVRD
jgi:hypothetical protein